MMSQPHNQLAERNKSLNHRIAKETKEEVQPKKIINLEIKKTETIMELKASQFMQNVRIFIKLF